MVICVVKKMKKCSKVNTTNNYYKLTSKTDFSLPVSHVDVGMPGTLPYHRVNLLLRFTLFIDSIVLVLLNIITICKCFCAYNPKQIYFMQNIIFVQNENESTDRNIVNQVLLEMSGNTKCVKK